MGKMDDTSQNNMIRAFKDDFLNAFLSCNDTGISVSGEASAEADAQKGGIEKKFFAWSDLYGGDAAEGNETAERIAVVLREYSNVIAEEGEKELAYSFTRDYFGLLVYLLNDLTGKSETPEFNKRRALLEELTLLGCCRIKGDNTYSVSSWHPVMLMQAQAERETLDELKEYTGMENTILKNVIEIKTRWKKQYKIYSYNEVYECMEDDGNSSHNSRAIRFSEKGRLTRIKAIRLIEKIEHYREKNTNSDEIIRIAVFGELCDIMELFEFYSKRSVIIEIITFERMKENGEYFFTASDYKKKGAEQQEIPDEMYNLLNQSDLEQLFDDYSIVLLLDYSFFYKQRQEPKSIEERNENTYADWYLKRADQYEKFKDKTACYLTAYHYVTGWINSYGRSRSGSYEFDDNLYMTLLNADRKAAEVYLYISCGNQIAGKSLHRQNICNDEYYDGNELIVYRYPEEENDINKDLETFLKSDVQREANVYIDMWKLVKSVSNEYYKEFAAEVLEREDDFFENISLLKNVYCGIDYSECRKGKLYFYIASEWNEQKLPIKKLEEFIGILLQHALGKRGIWCVKKYFRELIVNSVISRANSVEDLLFAYLLGEDEFEDCKWEKKAYKCDVEPGGNSLENGFKVRRTLFSVIEHMDAIRLRSGENMEDYFLINFRARYCADVSEEGFREIMSVLRESCKKYDYMRSRLYLYTEMKNEK